MTRTVYLKQLDNLGYDSARPISNVNSPYIYRVEKTVNSLSPRIGEMLHPDSVSRLMMDRINVSIQK